MEGLAPAPPAYRDLLRQKLADATRRIQWTYSIFWIFSPEQQALVWGEGCVNNAEFAELSLRRSLQLRELFVSMSANIGVTQQPSSEASAGGLVSPQELSPTEWFYMCSMACSFASGAGLPGKAFVEKRHVWHCVTGEGDTRVCLRAQFAQRAQIQTVVCIPTLDGIVEFGTTALVEEDTHLLQQMQSVFLEQPALHPTRTGSTGDRPERFQTGALSKSSDFKRWTNRSQAPHRQEFLQRHRQRMLKTAVLTIPHLYAVKKTRVNMEPFSARAGERISNSLASRNAHAIAERRRRERLNNTFLTLRRLVPWATKPDKVSLLGDTIEYIKGLQRRVEELQSGEKELEKANIQQHVEMMITLQLEVVDATAKVSDGVLKATLKSKVITSSNKDDEVRTAEIKEALLSAIEEKLSDNAATRTQ